MCSKTKTPEISVTPPEVPGFPLTKEFIEIVFEKEVETFTNHVGTNPGDNYLSIMHAIKVIFKGEKEAKHYLVKCYPNHPGRREFLDQMNIFQKELFWYTEFFPELKNSMEESDLVDFSVPPVHAGSVATSPSPKFADGPWANENFIVMTDLRKPLGYKMADRIRGLDFHHSKLAIQEISKLHALSWAYKKVQGLHRLTSKYEYFIDQMYGNTSSKEQFKPLMDAITSSSLNAVKDSLGDEHPAYLGLKALFSQDIVELMSLHVQKEGIDEDLIESKLRIKPEEDKAYVKDPWLVTTHGDFWVNNMMFLYDDQDPPKPKRVTAVDFQIIRESCPTVDLTYFIYSSVRSPVRKAHKAELLRVYHDAFIQHCKVLQVDPLPGFNYETLQRRFKRAGLFGIMVSLPLLTFVLKPPEDATDLDAGEGSNIADVFASVVAGNDKNIAWKDEITSIALELYEDGAI